MPPNALEGIDLFAGDGEMSRLMRAHDWSATSLGSVEHWPQSLKIVVRILLDSRYAMWLGWGPEFTFFYNDAYAQMTLGAKHPWALGRSAREVWAEIWSDIGPRAESVVRTGKATWDERLLLFLERRGFPEETYHTFSYSPVPSDEGGVGGMLCVVTEDTERTIGERRLRTLRELAAGTTEEARSAEEACQSAARILERNRHDLPFVLLYLIDADANTARLAGATGLPAGSQAAPTSVDLTGARGLDAGWRFRTVQDSGQAEVVIDIEPWLGQEPIGVYPEPPHTAAVLPLRKSGQDRLAGFVVVGVSPRRPFDDDYRGFFDLLSGQIATAVANARAYEEERRRAEALAELDRAKTTFFSNVSHEFRTPLTLMLGPVEDALAETNGQLPPAERERLELVHRNGLRLKKLVNTLLDFSRIEAGRIQASFAPTDLGSYTAELASSFRSACERAGLELTVECPPSAEPVYVDREMWEKVVLNLLSNAFKYTLAGRIEVSLRQTNRLAELAVRDTGTGIPPEQMPHLFERFHRVEGAQGRTQEGSGIGLALVKELVRLHGGEVWAESRVGEGSTFRVTVPLGTAHLPQDRIAASRTVSATALDATAYVEEATRWLPESVTSGEWRVTSEADEGSLSLVACHAPHARPRPRILLADDNADMRIYIRRLLAEEYDVIAVADGLAARDSALHAPPDLLLSDVMMPGLDGFGLLRDLRADPHTQGIPVILLSARAGEEARVEGLDAGADDYLTKPFSARELLARVASTLKIARLRRAALDQERRLLAEAEEQRNWLRVTLASIGDAVIATDTASRVKFLNPVAEVLTGWREEEARGRSLNEIFAISDEASGQPVDNAAASVLRQVRLVGLANHTVLTARDGTRRPIDDSAAPIQAADGTVLGVVLIFRDIAERRLAEQEIGRLNRDLQRRVTEFQTLLEVIPIGIAVADDPACRRIWSNPAMLRLLHLNSGANISLSAPSHERPDFRVFEKGRELSPDQLPMQTAIATQREVRGVKHDFLLGDGMWVNLLNYAVPLYDEAGQVRGGLYAGVDVTEQEQAHQAMREAERRFRAVFNQQFEFMVIMTPDGTVLEANETCFQATGVDREGVLGRRLWETPWWDRLPAMQEQWRQLIAEAVRTGGPVAGAVDYAPADGSVRHAAAVVTGMKDEAGRVTMLIAEGRDDTDRKRAEAALRQSEQRWRTMAETLPNLVWTDLPDGHCDWLSSQWGKYTGVPEQELLGLRWLELVHPDDRQRTLECWQEACADRRDYDLEYRIRRHDGQYRWFKTRGVPIRDENGKIIYWFGTCTDIEDHKRAEEALREADRRKDEFLATLAHELRNPLAPIRSSLQILKMPRLDGATIERSREMMERQVQHLVRLVDDLLDVSRVMRGKITLHRERVELAEVVARAVETAQPFIDAQSQELKVSLPDESLPLDADPVRLAQVVGNLLTNAAKYTEPKGCIWVTAQRMGDEAVLRVRDTGIGIAPDMLPKVFDLFVQVDHAAARSQGGLGIGLTLVKNLVQMHGGSVEAHSEGLGKGSEFIVRLGLMKQAVQDRDNNANSGDSQQSKPSSGLRLMVVDDNRDAADSLAMLLRLQGHEVRVAHAGPAALTILKDYRPDMIFLDLGMPGMDGYEVARRLRQEPEMQNVRLAALTGWGQQEDRQRTQEAGFNFHIVKPVDPALLEKLLARPETAKV